MSNTTQEKITELESVLMKRDELSLSEAKELINDMREEIESGEDAEDVLYSYGIEMDYIFDVLF